MDTFYNNPAAPPNSHSQQVQNSPFPGQEAPTGSILPQHPHAHLSAMNAMLHSHAFPMMQPTIPLGLQALYDSCLRAYPDQSDALQVTAVVKYW